ncbi:hypothetical protein IEI94_09010 [Halomonas sp. ML-15]|uniref:hypothetical protein n=1 Tax=Halomonas sp. ML-15 TaxID=2773305 RepID=UPI001747D391|nr:hypothetical protein [Halomonas sp. ML-15]MBD3895988.1 hypothetical protein [Halomonas sp. ML-15]
MAKQEDRWAAGFGGEGVSDDAFVSRDQPLGRLQGSVRQYESPLEPVGVEDWVALDLEGDIATPRGGA